MNVGQTLLTVGVAPGLACASAVAVIVIAKFRRVRVGARAKAMLAPHRGALIVMASGEDEDK